MKKSSIFVIIVAFILSIFMISFYGLSVRTDHFTTYIKNVEITHCTVINNGSRLDYQYIGKGENRRKVARLDFAIGEGGSIGLYLEHTIEPDTIPSDQYEFEIVDGNEKFVVIVDEEPVEYYYAELVKNKLTINHPCSIKIVLRALDGSGKEDSLTIICRDYSAT